MTRAGKEMAKRTTHHTSHWLWSKRLAIDLVLLHGVHSGANSNHLCMLLFNSAWHEVVATINSLLKQHELHIKEHSGQSFAPPPTQSLASFGNCWQLVTFYVTISPCHQVILSSSPLFICSVPNSSYRLTFVKIRAKYGYFFGKNTAIIRAKLSWCCRLFVI